MLLVHYSVVPAGGSIQAIDQRWRTIEIDPAVFTGLDLATPQGKAAAIRRINDGQIPNVQPIPHGVVLFGTETSTADSWTLALTITKNP